MPAHSFLEVLCTESNGQNDKLECFLRVFNVLYSGSYRGEISESFYGSKLLHPHNETLICQVRAGR